MHQFLCSSFSVSIGRFQVATATFVVGRLGHGVDLDHSCILLHKEFVQLDHCICCLIDTSGRESHTLRQIPDGSLVGALVYVNRKLQDRLGVLSCNCLNIHPSL